MDRLSQAQIQNYTLISKIGEGASAEVILAKHNETKNLCVLKMIQKSLILDQSEKKRAIQERQALTDLYHPFLIKMHQAFQTRNHFCLAMEYCPGGDLYTHLHMSQQFSEEKICQYAAQLVLALEYLHSQNIIFRDLKPQNLLIDKDGYLKLIDFGMSKSRISSDKFRTFSTCGTSEYTAPQMVAGLGHGRAFDWWTLGCCLYELIHRISPFYDDDRNEMFEKILNDQPIFTEEISETLKNLIMGLLEKNPQKRMEFVKQIKNHSFFANIDFKKVLRKQYPAQYVPEYARGKKMVKVNKEEVSIYTQFDNDKMTKSVYVSGFDFNCGEDDETAESSEQENQDKTQKVSTEDGEEDNFSDPSNGFFEEYAKKCKSMWETF